MHRALCTVALLLWAVTAQAAGPYYVSNSIGSDSNNCTAAQNPATPKATISGAAGGVTCLSSGETLRIMSGVYTSVDDVIDTNYRNIPAGANAGARTIISGEGYDVTLQPVDVTACRFSDSTDEYIEVRDIIFDYVNTYVEEVCYSQNGAGNLRFFQNELKNGYNFGFVSSNTGDGGNEYISNAIHHMAVGRTENTVGHGFYLGTVNETVERNYVYDNAGYGVHITDNTAGGSTATSGAIVRYNNIYRNGLTHATGFGVLVAYGTGLRIENNRIFENNGGIWAAALVKDSTIANNTIVDNLLQGIRGEFYNSGNVIRNNISYGNADNYEDFGTNGDGCPGYPTGCDLTESHNLLDGTDPEFVNEATHNYHLEMGSPAVDAGTTVASVTDDFDGNSRPQPAMGDYDIGAYEYTEAVEGDETAPVVTISTNSGNNFLQTPSPTVALAGTCTDAVGCVSVSYTSPCGNGTAVLDGENWTVDILFTASGACAIQMHGQDAAANDGHDEITVTVYGPESMSRRVGRARR